MSLDSGGEDEAPHVHVSPTVACWEGVYTYIFFFRNQQLAFESQMDASIRAGGGSCFIDKSQWIKCK